MSGEPRAAASDPVRRPLSRRRLWRQRAMSGREPVRRPLWRQWASVRPKRDLRRARARAAAARPRALHACVDDERRLVRRARPSVRRPPRSFATTTPQHAPCATTTDAAHTPPARPRTSRGARRVATDVSGIIRDGTGGSESEHERERGAPRRSPFRTVPEAPPRKHRAPFEGPFTTEGPGWSLACGESAREYACGVWCV